MSQLDVTSPPDAEVRPTILVVEDDPAMLRLLRLAFEERGYEVLGATTGARAVSLAFEAKPSLILLDLGLPDIDGVDVTKRIRECSRMIPIVVLSARSAEQDIVEALDGGANDYVIKPFRERELFARIRALLRTHSALRAGEPTFGAIRVDPALRRVFLSGRDVKLSATEYKLFAVLARAGGAAVTHRQLLRDVWGPGHLDEVQYLRVYIRHLREKLEADPGNPRYVLTEPGIGYRLRTSDGPG